MKRRLLKNLSGGLAFAGLASCLAVAIFYFLGCISEGAYKTIFLLASAAWFVFAILRTAAAGKSEGSQ